MVVVIVMLVMVEVVSDGDDSCNGGVSVDDGNGSSSCGVGGAGDDGDFNVGNRTKWTDLRMFRK